MIVNLSDFNILASRFGQALSATPFAKSPVGGDRGGENPRNLLKELT
jgi:hypothetical protein